MPDCSQCERDCGACWYEDVFEEDDGDKSAVVYCIVCYRKVYPIEGKHYSTVD